ncbi:uncharacterized protein BDW47DRAFT_104601 [Aspergillus candidus]|uniref:C2H2-type domain-containing protein n=1 Tax=Aspergillus candidus TaxID=41067 RepID=A0A2I2FDG0_ASPCN|nr:hypothetical protein BDW47DRAFT_104601 [Aspergillus candidus]PLB38634.1 hypothetical protein BDW47DRAFT_104601 [Aspergillus candidus]
MADALDRRKIVFSGHLCFYRAQNSLCNTTEIAQSPPVRFVITRNVGVEYASPRQAKCLKTPCVRDDSVFRGSVGGGLMVVVSSSGGELRRYRGGCSLTNTVGPVVLGDTRSTLHQPLVTPITPHDEGGANQTIDPAGPNTIDFESSPCCDYEKPIDSIVARGLKWIKNEELHQQNENHVSNSDDEFLAFKGSISKLGTKHDRLKSSNASPRPQELPKLLPNPTKAMPTSEPPPKKKFLCDLDGCDKTYPRKNGLNKHQKNKHNAPPKKAGRPRKTR